MRPELHCSEGGVDVSGFYVLVSLMPKDVAKKLKSDSLATSRESLKLGDKVHRMELVCEYASRQFATKTRRRD